MRWFVVSVVGALAIAGFLAARFRRGRHPADVGPVSDEWIAAHRVISPDTFR